MLLVGISSVLLSAIWVVLACWWVRLARTRCTVSVVSVKKRWWSLIERLSDRVNPRHSLPIIVAADSAGGELKCCCRVVVSRPRLVRSVGTMVRRVGLRLRCRCVSRVLKLIGTLTDEVR